MIRIMVTIIYEAFETMPSSVPETFELGVSYNYVGDTRLNSALV